MSIGLTTAFTPALGTCALAVATMATSTAPAPQHHRISRALMNKSAFHPRTHTHLSCTHRLTSPTGPPACPAARHATSPGTWARARTGATSTACNRCDLVAIRRGACGQTGSGQTPDSRAGWRTQFLRKKGHLPEEPTGYFGEATETAVKKWQSADAIAGSRDGALDLSSRKW